MENIFFLIKLFLIELSKIIYFGWLTKIYIKRFKRLHIIFLNGKIMASERVVWTYYKDTNEWEITNIQPSGND